MDDVAIAPLFLETRALLSEVRLSAAYLPTGSNRKYKAFNLKSGNAAALAVVCAGPSHSDGYVDGDGAGVRRPIIYGADLFLTSPVCKLCVCVSVCVFFLSHQDASKKLREPRGGF